MKNFRMGERFNLQFRSDFFNFSNHPNFGLPGTTLNTPAFGVIASARDPRQIQFGLNLTF